MQQSHLPKAAAYFGFLIVSIALTFMLFQPSHAQMRVIMSNAPEETHPGENVSVRSEKVENNLAAAKSRPSFVFEPIGFFHSPYSPENRPPRQGHLAPDVSATIEIYPEFEEGLEGIEDFDYIYVLFVFDRSQGWTAKVTPPGATKPRGVFASRSNSRPCPIGLTVVRLEKRDGRILHVKGIDAFDQTPVLDIKPYIGKIDAYPEAGQNAIKSLGLPW